MRGGAFLSVAEASKATGMTEHILRKFLRDGCNFGIARRNTKGRMTYLIYPLQFKEWCRVRGIRCKLD